MSKSSSTTFFQLGAIPEHHTSANALLEENSEKVPSQPTVWPRGKRSSRSRDTSQDYRAPVASITQRTRKAQQKRFESAHRSSDTIPRDRMFRTKPPHDSKPGHIVKQRDRRHSEGVQGPSTDSTRRKLAGNILRPREDVQKQHGNLQVPVEPFSGLSSNSVQGPILLDLQNSSKLAPPLPLRRPPAERSPPGTSEIRDRSSTGTVERTSKGSHSDRSGSNNKSASMDRNVAPRSQRSSNSSVSSKNQRKTDAQIQRSSTHGDLAQPVAVVVGVPQTPADFNSNHPDVNEPVSNTVAALTRQKSTQQDHSGNETRSLSETSDHHIPMVGYIFGDMPLQNLGVGFSSHL